MLVSSVEWDKPPVFVNSEITRVNWVGELPRFQVDKCGPCWSADDRLHFYRHSQVARLADGFQPIQLCYRVFVSLVEFTDDAISDARFVEHHRCEPRTGNQHRITVACPANPAKTAAGKPLFMKRKASLQSSESKDVPCHPGRPLRSLASPIVRMELTQLLLLMLQSD